MRIVLAGAAVLCLCLVQPASAAWQTSAPGQASAKAGTVTPLEITSCGAGKPTVVTWQPVPGADMYTVLWQQGNGVNAPFSESAITSSTTYSVPSQIARVRVQAKVGSWTTTHSQMDCP